MIGPRRKGLAFDADPADRRQFWLKLVVKILLFLRGSSIFLGLIVFYGVHRYE